MALNDMLGALAKYGENHNQDISKIRDLMNDPEPEQVHYGRGQNPNSQKNLKSGNSGNKGSSGKKWITNDTEEKPIGINDPIPDGWHTGRLFKKRKSKRSEQIREIEEQVQDVLISLSKQSNK